MIDRPPITRLRASSAVLAGLALVACSRRSATTTATAERTDAAARWAPSSASAAPAPERDATPTARATLTLLDPGRAPRHALRYAWSLANHERLEMTLRTTASAEESGAKQPEVPFPVVRVIIDVDPRQITSDGDLRYEWRVASAYVEEGDDAPAPVAEGMRSAVRAIEHLHGSGWVDAHGLAREIVIAPDDAAAGGTTGSQMVEQVDQTLRDVAAPLPDEEVGAGARWRKLSHLDARDARITQTETFRLVAWEPGGGTLDDITAQTAPPQPLRAPGRPESSPARMESMLLSGDAKIRFDLTRLVPQTSFDGTATIVASGPAATEGAPSVTMVMRVGEVIAGYKR